jgi:DNA-binding PucR family transcriptional regulator
MTMVQRALQTDVHRHVEQILNSVSPLRLGEEMTEQLISSIPPFRGQTDEDFRAGLLLSCQSNLRTIWQQLLSGAPTDQVVPPHEAISWAHELVHRGMDLSVLLRAYRLGHAMVEERFETVAAELDIPREIRWRVLAEASRYLFAYVDAVCTRLVQDYEQERARWIRGAMAARAELVKAIIEGETVDARAATATLRYDVTRRHLGFIVWADAVAQGGAVGSAALDAAAVALAAEFGGGQVLTVQIGERVVWAWTAHTRPAEPEEVSASALHQGMRAAVGRPHQGLRGMARSHHEARAARRVSELLASRSATITGYRSVSLTALLTIDPGEATRFVEAELGKLADMTEATIRLRDTLRVYLDEKQSPTRAARRLGVHENTVTYRVKQSEEILKCSIDERRLELETALLLSEGLRGLRETHAVGGAPTS